MSTSASSSAALPLAHVLLRILIIGNWLMCAAILILLFVAPNAEWIISSMDLTPGPDADRVILGFRAIALLGLIGVPLNYAILTRLLAMVETVRAGDPFVPANAARLQLIAWLMLVLQLLSMAIGAIADSLSTPAHQVDLDAGFSVNGWLAVLMTFLLARVFAAGTTMRDDLEGTI
jgi:hypothetical protein